MIERVLPLVGSATLALTLGGTLFLATQRTNDATAGAVIAPPASEATTMESNEIVLPVRRGKLYYAAITDRPLFTPSRRPHVVSSTESEKPTPDIVEPEPVVDAVVEVEIEEPMPDFRLLGVFAAGASRKALIAVGDNAPSWLEDGANIQGWNIGAVSTRGVTISKNGKTFDLEIYPK